MGHFGAQTARPGPEPGRAGRKTIIVSSDLSERIDYNIPDLPIYARRDAFVVVPGLPLPMSPGIAIWNSSMSSAVRCNISSTAP